MGWFSDPIDHNPSPSERKKLLDDNYTYSSGKGISKVLKSTMKGSTYYAVIHFTPNDGSESISFAVVVLTKYEDGELWMKSMDESMGPYAYDMPPSYLDLLTPTDNEYALKWRERVRENSSVKKRKFADRKWDINGKKSVSTAEMVRELSASTGYPEWAIEDTAWIKKMTPGQVAKVKDTEFTRTYARKAAKPKTKAKTAVKASKPTPKKTVKKKAPSAAKKGRK